MLSYQYHRGFMTLFRKVPVIVLWTKTDSLDLGKIKQLMKEGKNQAEAMEQAPKKAWDDFERKNYPIFNTFKYQPKAHVVFRSEHYILFLLGGYWLIIWARHA